jgi:hypothetical protein
MVILSVVEVGAAVSEPVAERLTEAEREAEREVEDVTGGEELRLELEEA